MIFSLDVRRARKGDCFLLHFGSTTKPGLAMIDGGPAKVYAPHLKPRLREIRKARKLDAQTPLPVELLMISHADDDHILGILDLTREILANPTQAPLIRASSFWHNSFDEIIGKDPAELTASLTAQFGAASLNVLASIAQGHRLRGDADTLGYPRNPEFNGKLILAAKKAVPVAEGLTFTVAGPMKPELTALQKKHDQWLKARKENKPTAALAAYVDESVTNLSSIVVLAKFGGKSMLLTGDARGDKVLKGLELTGALKKDGVLKVDILKVPHHGSANNLDVDFFQRIQARHYVFSGDGQHGNPERETFEMLFKARGGEPFSIHLTYPVDEIDAGRKADWEKKPVKGNWSPEKHGLAALFAKTKFTKDQKIEIADKMKPHVINLLDPLGF